MTTRSFLVSLLPVRPGARLAAVALATALSLSTGACTSTTDGTPSVGPGPEKAPLPVGSPTTDPTCPAVTTDTASVAVTTFRSTAADDPDGCVPPERLVAWRCRPGNDPVISTGFGTSRERRYLGGRFAVPLRILPGDARSLGVAREAEVFRFPEDPSFLYVRDDNGLVRWLALPDPGTLAEQPEALLIGDSILDGARYDVQDELSGWTTTIEAEIGRSSSSGVALAQAREFFPPTVAVVELGTNDADPSLFADNARSILDALDAAPVVAWVTVHSPLEGVPEINTQIRRSVAVSPNAVLVDWSRGAPEDAFQTDGVHLLPDRTHEFADLLVPRIRAWYAATTGRGATACGSEIAAG